MSETELMRLLADRHGVTDRAAARQIVADIREAIERGHTIADIQTDVAAEWYHVFPDGRGDDVVTRAVNDLGRRIGREIAADMTPHS
jgi:DNA-binding GntR family transcriptional regulator